MTDAVITLSSEEAGRLLQEQLKRWPLAAANYHALRLVETRSYDLGGFTIRTQYNPARIVSSGAKTDAKSIEKRPCFLCLHHLPKEQIKLSFRFGEEYLLLCNPYPIFSEHFTIPSVAHQPQEITSRLEDFLRISRALDKYTLFYNGPKSGASAPDHAHFQAVSSYEMPLDGEIDTIQTSRERILIDTEEGSLSLLTHYVRNGFVIRTKSLEQAKRFFYLLCNVAGKGEEPDMNLFCRYRNEMWQIVLILRKAHRPWQYAAQGEEQILTSPGAADVGGLFITPRREDFDKITVAVLRDIYGQVCYNDAEIAEFRDKIMANWHNIKNKP
ncbi:hypothetical protein M2137_000387 [Parabacteroides sp. PFB2-10]|uniref:DUF4922 domain-containing protein n=1 Tax=Parabacteroides sp. PFB2-10 TaxID=1742405 RepID=UPI002472F865|nr:DUF4922 domain-containing protein [Parabacteroides sp. PFB2-10]MDH6311628.1 hypothetical protein [Parabacteroides sp. PFB2-10]